MDMSWRYVAGFFDGEGCIHLGQQQSQKHAMPGLSTGSPRISIVQAMERGREVLEAIAAFLWLHDIASTVGVHNKGSYHCKRSYHLRITGFRQVIPFLVKVQPYLWVKRVESQDMIRYARLFPSLKGLHAHLPESTVRAWETRRRLYGGSGYRKAKVMQ